MMKQKARNRGIVFPCLVIASALLLSGARGASAQAVELVSVSTSGEQSFTLGSGGVSISDDGRFVAFSILSLTLVPDDTNQALDVFVRDRMLGVTERASVSSFTAQANGSSLEPSISSDGRFVVFTSQASNLDPRDSNSVSDIFLRDRERNTTDLVSVSNTSGAANGQSREPRISANGRFVVFVSTATNLVAGQAFPGDVFVRDLEMGTTELINQGTIPECADPSPSPERIRTPAISADGRFVAFLCGSTNTAVLLFDRSSGTTERINVNNAGEMGTGTNVGLAVSPDGRLVAFSSDATNLVPNDTNGVFDVFVRDRQTSSTERLSIGRLGQEGDAFSAFPSFSGDGRLVSFFSFATTLVDADTSGNASVFVRDRRNGTTALASANSAGASGNGSSGGGFRETSISRNGRFVVFSSGASNLVDVDTNSGGDVFVKELPLSPQVQTFARFGADVSLRPHGNHGDDRLVVQGTFTLGDGGAIDPSSEDVTISVRDQDGAIFERTSPAGSFKPEPDSTVRDESIAKRAGSFTIAPGSSPNTSEFRLVLKEVDVPEAGAGPLTISLGIGNEAGSVLVDCVMSKKRSICR